MIAGYVCIDKGDVICHYCMHRLLGRDPISKDMQLTSEAHHFAGSDTLRYIIDIIYVFEEFD